MPNSFDVVDERFVAYPTDTDGICFILHLSQNLIKKSKGRRKHRNTLNNNDLFQNAFSSYSPNTLIIKTQSRTYAQKGRYPARGCSDAHLCMASCLTFPTRQFCNSFQLIQFINLGIRVAFGQSTGIVKFSVFLMGNTDGLFVRPCSCTRQNWQFI